MCDEYRRAHGTVRVKLWALLIGVANHAEAEGAVNEAAGFERCQRDTTQNWLSYAVGRVTPSSNRLILSAIPRIAAEVWASDIRRCDVLFMAMPSNTQRIPFNVDLGPRGCRDGGTCTTSASSHAEM